MWKCYHLDDIHEEMEPLPSWKLMKDKTIGELFEYSVNESEQNAVGAVKSQFDAGYIIQNCLHKSVASLIDMKTVTNRKAHRLNLLLKLLKGNAKQKVGVYVSVFTCLARQGRKFQELFQRCWPLSFFCISVIRNSVYWCCVIQHRLDLHPTLSDY